ncbi:DUF3000 domain-containing protein [Nocardioides sp. BGMRC 2183]|nr:DUF3000 domain-containing protein [Nocardioides sp. BGMRC 2183]
MVARQETRPGAGEAVPAEFATAVAQLRAARFRAEIFCEEMPAPQRIAPYAAALSADVTDEDDDEVATGRLVLLHDPAGNDAWHGTFRCVAYCRAEIEHNLAADPMLADVGWTWLIDALEAHGAEHDAASGTVTRVTTENFGAMADDPGSAQVEIRASWTPRDPTEMTAHVEAWAELLCTAGGLEPVPDGVAVMPSRRGQRGTTS